MQSDNTPVTIPALAANQPLSQFPASTELLMANHVWKATRRAAIRKDLTPGEYLAQIIHAHLYDTDAAFAKDADSFADAHQELAAA